MREEFYSGYLKGTKFLGELSERIALKLILK
jgi:hypothetical protein